MYTILLRTYRLFIRRAAAAGHRKAHRRVILLREPAIFPDFHPLIWIHAASAGEGNQAVPLAKALKARGAAVFISFHSPSGLDFHRDTAVFDGSALLPDDLPEENKCWLDRMQPDAAVFIRNELWPGYLCALTSRSIPAYLVNAPEHVLQPPAWKKRWTQRQLSLLQRIYSNSPAPPEGLPVSHDLMGDTKWEAAALLSDESDQRISRFFSGNRGLVCGSTWPEEERMIQDWVRAHPEVRVLIAPHEISTERVAALENRFPGSVRWSAFDARPEGARVMILDTVGRLPAAYRHARFAIIGGGFGKGIHNILEAAACGVPTAFGPRHRKFPEARELISEGMAFEFRHEKMLTGILESWYDNEEGLRNIRVGLSARFARHNGLSARIAGEILSDVNRRTSGR